MVTRAGEGGTEFLLVHNAGYGGYFFPTQRVKTEVKPDRVAIGTVRSDLGYRGPASATHRGEVADVHFSNRFQRDRQYNLHVCEVLLAEVDLHQPGNVLERALLDRDKPFLRLSAGRLDDPTIAFSLTMPAVRSSVLNAIPSHLLRTAPPLGRRHRPDPANHRRGSGWLARWNDNWKALFFVGGHREGDETYRECAIREIGEELGLTPSECPVSASCASHLEYRAISHSAGELTEYVIELFCSHPNQEGLRKIDGDPRNK